MDDKEKQNIANQQSDYDKAISALWHSLFGQ